MTLLDGMLVFRGFGNKSAFQGLNGGIYMTRFYYHGWTGAEDQQLAEIMQNGERDRKKVLELFNEAAATLQRTPKSCQNRWYEIRAREAV